MPRSTLAQKPPSHQASPTRAEQLRDSLLGRVLLLALVGVLAIAGAWLMNRAPANSSPVDMPSQASDPPRVGDVAPAFEARTIDEETFDLEAHRGQPVWLSFVATWCSSCRAEAPDIEDAWRGSSGEVAVASVYLGEGEQDVAQFSQRLDATYPQLPDPGREISAGYGVVAVPSHVFIDAEGRVHSIKVGVLTRQEMDEALAELTGSV